MNINQPIIIDQVKYALNKMVKRHEPLRTLFNKKKEPYLINTDPIIEISNRSLTNEHILEHFKLVDGSIPLLKAIIIGNDIYIIAHHIAFDGWSTIIFKKEFMMLYNNKEYPDGLSYTYQDYCKWEEDYLKSLRYQKSLDWWKSIINKDFIQDLPYDSYKSSLSLSTIYVSTYTNYVNVNKWNMLCTKYGLSTYNLFQLVLSILFSLMSLQNKVYLAGVTANRPNLKAELLLGMFVNTVIYVYDINTEEIFSEYFLKGKKRYYQVLSNSQVPFENYFIGSPQVMTSTSMIEDTTISTDLLEGVEYNINETKKSAGKFDLHIDINLVRSTFKLGVYYKDSKFKESTIKQMIENIWIIIDKLEENRKIKDIIPFLHIINSKDKLMTTI